MKKLLMIILMTSIVSPTFAYADNKSEQKGENSSRKAVQTTQKIEKVEKKAEKKEIKNVVKDFKKEIRKEEKKEVKKPKKINYFFCVTATDWKVVPVEALKDNNSNNYLGEDCVKLPSNIAKRLQTIMGGATTTPDVTAPVISTVVPFTVASTTATASWTTNESSTGKLWYGTSTPSTLLATTTSGLTHSFSLTGLTASTTYQILFEAKDSANNTATSTASLATTN